jgi:hypothetical protein
MSTRFVYCTLALLASATPAAAQDELTFFSCGVTGKSELLESYETGPVFLFSIAVKGLQLNPGPDAEKHSVSTSMVADRHKLLGGGEVTEAISKNSGFMLNAYLPDKRLVSMIFVPNERQPTAYRLEFLGLKPKVADRWAEMSGRCNATFSKDGRIPSDFFNALYPQVEKSASEAFSAKAKANGNLQQ